LQHPANGLNGPINFARRLDDLALIIRHLITTRCLVKKDDTYRFLIGRNPPEHGCMVDSKSPGGAADRPFFGDGKDETQVIPVIAHHHGTLRDKLLVNTVAKLSQTVTDFLGFCIALVSKSNLCINSPLLRRNNEW
jgi:hypothetical protein